MKKMPKQLKEFVKTEKIKNQYGEKIIVKNENTFIKLLSFYPNVIISTLKDSKKLDLYVKILECSI